MKQRVTIGCVSDYVEVSPGNFEEVSVQFQTNADVRQFAKTWKDATGSNDDLMLKQTISVVVSPDKMKLLPTIAWVEVFGSKWQVTSMEIKRPRIELTLGGVWNGPETA